MRRHVRWVSFAATAIAAIAIPSATFSATTPTHGYVASTLSLPVTSAQAKAFGRDIDGNGHVDNAFGAVFTAFAGNGVDFAGTTQAAVTSGKLLMLDALRTPSFKKTKKATWQVLYAKPTASPNLSGGGSFTVDPNAPHSSPLKARITKGRLTTAAGSVPLKLDLGGGVITLHLQKAVIFATCKPSGCSGGRITGVVPLTDVQNIVYPQFAAQFTVVVQRDCPGSDASSCASNSQGKSLQQLFDANGDLTITVAELEQNGLMQSLFAPDIDTNHDGTKDGLSFGVAFTAVPAKIVRN